MYLQRAAFVWVGVLLGFIACSPGPSTGTSTTTGTTTTTGTSGTGGMDAGVCEHRDDFYDLCGDCERCLEENCCAELTACVNEPGCIDCTAHNPDAAGPCFQHIQNVLLGCSEQCQPCYPGLDATPSPGCFRDAGPDSGTGGSSM